MDRQQRLDALRNKPRVWDSMSAENVTPGLIDLCNDWIKPDFVMAEIGCCAGVSTAVFANFAAKVYAVDPWTLTADTGYGEIPQHLLADAEKEFDKVAADYPNIIKVRDFSKPASNAWIWDTVSDGWVLAFPLESLSAVYIDGDHRREAFAADVDCWLPKIKPGGLLMGHDWSYVIAEDLEKRGMEPIKLYPEGSWVVQLEKACHV